jgi:hypothetical protein
MRNLRRRIEALEKSSAGRRDVRPAIVVEAMEWLQADDVESLMAAYGADRVGRPLTEREAAARQDYATALERECRGAGLHSTTGFEPTADSSRAMIGQAIVRVLAHRLTPEEIRLGISGVRAAQKGDAPTEQETAAQQAYLSQMERVCQLTGFKSLEELRAFQCGAELSEGGERRGNETPPESEASFGQVRQERWQEPA